MVNRCSALLARGRCPVLAGILNEGDNRLTYDQILRACREGDAEAEAALRECGIYLGMGIANIINLFSPQRILINGDVLLQSDVVYKTALSEAMGRINERLAGNTAFTKLDIGPGESIRGIAIHVTDRLLERSGAIL